MCHLLILNQRELEASSQGVCSGQFILNFSNKATREKNLDVAYCLTATREGKKKEVTVEVEDCQLK